MKWLCKNTLKTSYCNNDNNLNVLLIQLGPKERGATCVRGLTLSAGIVPSTMLCVSWEVRDDANS